MDPYEIGLKIFSGSALALSLGISIPYFTREFTKLSLLEQMAAEDMARTAKKDASPEWTKPEFYSTGRIYLTGLEDGVKEGTSSPIAEKDSLAEIFYSKGYDFGLSIKELPLVKDGNKPPVLHSWKILRSAYRQFRKKETSPQVVIR